MRQLRLVAAVFGVGLAVAGAAALTAELLARSWLGMGLALPAGAQVLLVVVVALAVLAAEAAAVRRRWWPAAIGVLPAGYAGAVAGLVLGLLAPLAALCIIGGVVLAVSGARSVLRA